MLVPKALGELFSNFSRLADEHIRRRRIETSVLLAEVEHGNLVLDIGCGEGDTIKMFADSLGFVVGLDKSLKALKKARSKPNASNINLCLGVAEKLPFRSFSFDKILMLELLEHVPNPRVCIKQADKCAKNNAIFVISLPLKEKLVCCREDGLSHRMGHLHSFDEIDVISLLPDYYRLLMKIHLPNAYIGRFTWLPLVKKLPFRMWLTINNVLERIKKGYYVLFKFRKLDNK